MGATYFFPRILGQARAYELLLTARVIMAEEALRIGLVSQVVDTDQVLATAQKIAQEILTCGPDSVKQLLASLRMELPDLESCLRREADCQAINYASSEFMEGVSATIEKRAPKFS
jgi:enoyl-CoA hydratase